MPAESSGMRERYFAKPIPFSNDQIKANPYLLSEWVQRIASDLNLSASTIGTHLYNIKQKLAVANQSELTLIAIRHGLINA